MTRSPPPIRICADDYGFSPGVSAAIRELASRRRLDATSAIVLFPEFDADLAALRALGGEIAVGLHLTLTGHAPLGPMPRLAPRGKLPSPAGLLALALAGRLDRDEIEAQTVRQFDRLQAALGRVPDFIDGHHHVQALPVVRDVVLELCRRVGTKVRRIDPPSGARPWRLPAPVKSCTLALLGRKLAAGANGLAMNGALLGVCGPDDRRPYGELFRRWLAVATPGTVIMCHPGFPDALLADRDSVVVPRAAQYDYLASATFPDDLARATAGHGA